VHPHSLPFDNDWTLILARTVTSLITLYTSLRTNYYPEAVVWLRHRLIHQLSLPGIIVKYGVGFKPDQYNLDMGVTVLWYDLQIAASSFPKQPQVVITCISQARTRWKA